MHRQNWSFHFHQRFLVFVQMERVQESPEKAKNLRRNLAQQVQLRRQVFQRSAAAAATISSRPSSRPCRVEHAQVVGLWRFLCSYRSTRIHCSATFSLYGYV
ncbi:hypothetical protein AVEN_266266-1 [Araneus ventricosus]|uniref:Uncharacterized protein n=1 Tax=Araneus ventricosus TaxID=182803 RepID=A0A4Y2G508_ARAVE|nr:hypothetical protein AVEN_266266-1 [Araneus ventricosus]